MGRTVAPNFTSQRAARVKCSARPAASRGVHIRGAHARGAASFRRYAKHFGVTFEHARVCDAEKHSARRKHGSNNHEAGQSVRNSGKCDNAPPGSWENTQNLFRGQQRRRERYQQRNWQADWSRALQRPARTGAVSKAHEQDDGAAVVSQSLYLYTIGSRAFWPLRVCRCGR